MVLGRREVGPQREPAHSRRRRGTASLSTSGSLIYIDISGSTVWAPRRKEWV